MPKRGKLIVFDAIDGAGKTTQVKLLVKRLRKSGKRVLVTDFPQYEKSFFGKMVRRYLQGEFGNAKQTNPYLISLLYALDRFEAKEKMQRYLDNGGIIVSDRYSPANKIHQASKIKNKKDKQKFIKWLDTMEFEVLGIPKPDLVLFLDVPPTVTKKLMVSRGARDMHEIDGSYQRKSYNESRELVRRFKHWRRIQCMSGNTLLPSEVIHERAWKEVTR